MHSIKHLAFADDLMVMARGDLRWVQILSAILKEFGDVSGLKANNMKSSLFLAGEHGREAEAIEEALQFSHGSFSFQD